MHINYIEYAKGRLFSVQLMAGASVQNENNSVLLVAS